MNSSKILVKVTQEHINKGQKGRCFHCPIALAINDAIPGAQAAIDMHECHFYPNRSSPRLFRILPKECSDFIQNFDWNDELPEPFEFELTL